MNSHHKRDAAIKLLDATGIWKSNYAPPLLKMMWALGIDCPLPHMVGFSASALVSGTCFALFMGLALRILEGQNAPHLLLSSVLAGVFFGLTMAAYYAYGRRKYQLPLWKNFHPVRSDKA